MSKKSALSQLEEIYEEVDCRRLIETLLRDLDNYFSGKQLEDFANFVKEERGNE